VDEHTEQMQDEDAEHPYAFAHADKSWLRKMSTKQKFASQIHRINPVTKKSFQKTSSNGSELARTKANMEFSSPAVLEQAPPLGSCALGGLKDAKARSQQQQISSR
jgi:hypothetical protein